jgi:hypothetical protein
MKKLLVIAFLFVLTTINAQGLFVRTYRTFSTVKNNVAEPLKNIFLNIVFNKDDGNFIEFVYDDGDSRLFSVISPLEEGETNSGHKYQLFKVLDYKTAAKLYMQFFDEDGVFRIIIAEGHYIEYYQ